MERIWNNDFTLSRDEATSFLHDVLGLNPPPLDDPNKNRETYVGEVMRAMLHHLPFQTVSAISTPQRDRHLPTPAEIKRDAFARLGGTCYQLNGFCWMLLQAFGFVVSLANCTSVRREHRDSHMVVIVHGLTRKGSEHLVDVGSGYPTFRPIPLDFRETSPVYHDSFLRYKFVREGHVIIRLHDVETDGARKEEFAKWTKHGWYQYFYLHLDKPVDMKFFQGAMTKYYTDPANGLLPFLLSVRCLTYPNGGFFCIKDTTLLVEEQGGVKKTYLRSRDEVLAKFAQYFPQVPQDMVKTALADENVILDFTKQNIL